MKPSIFDKEFSDKICNLYYPIAVEIAYINAGGSKSYYLYNCWSEYKHDSEYFKPYSRITVVPAKVILRRLGGDVIQYIAANYQSDFDIHELWYANDEGDIPQDLHDVYLDDIWDDHRNQMITLVDKLDFWRTDLFAYVPDKDGIIKKGGY